MILRYTSGLTGLYPFRRTISLRLMQLKSAFTSSSCPWKGPRERRTIDLINWRYLTIILPDKDSPDFEEIQQLVDKHKHGNYNPRLLKRYEWNTAISLMTIVHKANKPGRRLCPFYPCAFIARGTWSVMVGGNAWTTIIINEGQEKDAENEEVQEHVKQAWADMSEQFWWILQDFAINTWVESCWIL